MDVKGRLGGSTHPVVLITERLQNVLVSATIAVLIFFRADLRQSYKKHGCLSSWQIQTRDKFC